MAFVIKQLFCNGGLSFDILRQANMARIPRFRNPHGDRVHASDGSDWPDDRWFKALVGEVGEFANLSKKHDRGDITDHEFRIEASKELADIQTYLDILAFRLGIDLGEATIRKFNEVSLRVNAGVRISISGRRVEIEDVA